MSPSADPADLPVAAAGPTVRARAANDVAASARSHEQVPPAGGWDPYEVWARRVRDPRRTAEPGFPG